MKVNWKKVRDRRIELNMTMEDLGNMIGVQRSAINKYEKGQIKNVSFEMFMKLTDALNVAPGYLMDVENVGVNGPVVPDPRKYVTDSMQSIKKENEYIDLDKFKNSSVGDQVKMILEVWSRAKKETKKMIIPVLDELNKLEE